MTQRRNGSGNQLRDRAVAALAFAFRQCSPGVALDPRGYVARLEDNLLRGVEFEPVRAAFEEGAGREADEKLRAVHSSAALVVNAFQPWMRAPGELRLAGRRGFSSLRFEAQFPIFASPHATAPHLDLFADGPHGVVAVESKLTEHLRAPAPSFSSAYDRLLPDQEVSPWSAWIQRLREQPRTFAWLDAAQLVKHSLGLRRARRSKTILFYLYWEPGNAADFPAFDEHRREVGEFASSVEGDSIVDFQSSSHREIWKPWLAVADPPWLPEHAQRLLARYDVSI